jgi:hypothetical protein
VTSLLAAIGFPVVALSLSANAYAGPTSRAAATQVRVTFSNTSLALSQTGVEAGTVTLVAVNHGRTSHVLAISGPGLRGVRTPKIAVGKSAMLTVRLATGAYMLADPLASAYNVRWLVVSPPVNVVSSGNGTVVTPVTVTTGMSCD